MNVRSLAVGLLQFPIATTTVHPPVVSSARPSFVSPIPLKPYLSTFFRTVGKYLKYLILRSSYQDPGFSQRFGSRLLLCVKLGTFVSVNCRCLFLCSDCITVCFHAGSSSGRSVPFLPRVQMLPAKNESQLETGSERFVCLGAVKRTALAQIVGLS